MSKLRFKIINIVAIARFNQNFDVGALKDKIEREQTCWIVKVPRALAIKLTNPKATILLGSTGSLIINGVRSEETAREVIRIVIKLLRNIGIEIHTEPAFTIINIVALANFRHFIPLERLSQNLSPSFYDPTVFSALIYRPRNSNISALLFASGKAVIAGATDSSDIARVLDEIRLTLEREIDEVQS